MRPFFLFAILWWLIGNPFIAILMLLIILYALDQRFVGLAPNIFRPFRRRRLIARLRQQVAINPSDVSAKHELARLLIEAKRYREARDLLEPMQPLGAVESSAEFWDDLGNSYLHTGETAKGEEAIRRALELNPRVKYGEPYLRLASLYSRSDTDKALEALESFRSIHSSSCEAYYRLSQINEQLGRKEEARRALDEALDVYRSLPKYMKRKERKWAARCRLKKLGLG